jgi:hypothetical protein
VSEELRGRRRTTKEKRTVSSVHACNCLVNLNGRGDVIGEWPWRRVTKTALTSDKIRNHR